MYLYTGFNTLSLFIAYGRQNPFSVGLIVEIQGGDFVGCCKLYWTLHGQALSGPALRADWSQVRKGHASHTLWGRCDNIIRVFLPRRYRTTITNEDMAAINDHTIQYYLSFKGYIVTSNLPMLQIVIRAVSLNYRIITSHESHGACFWRC